MRHSPTYPDPEPVAEVQVHWFGKPPFSPSIWLHYAATKFARGELYEAIGMLGFFREQVLGPLFHRRAGKNQRGVRRLELLRLDEHERLATTFARHDAASVRDAIEACIDLYVDLQADDPALKKTRLMPDLLRDFIGRGMPDMRDHSR